MAVAVSEIWFGEEVLAKAAVLSSNVVAVMGVRTVAFGAT